MLNKYSTIYRLFWIIWKILTILMPWIWPVDPVVRWSFRTNLKRKDYDFVIAVEKESLLAATQRYHGTKTKIIFWSLELYNQGHPSYFKHKNLDVKARNNYKYLSGFLIQDPLRWEVINRDSHIEINPFYLPICVRGPVVSVDKKAVRKKYGIDVNATVIIAHGNISNDRGLRDIIELASHVHENIIILVQGKLLQRVPVNLPHNLIIKDVVFEEDELMQFIAMADIGLALYSDVSENTRFIAFSSHKIAIYARCGLPYIAYHNESFEALHKNIMWGITINNVEEIPHAIYSITANYKYHQKQAYSAYEMLYSLDLYKNNLLLYLT